MTTVSLPGAIVGVPYSTTLAGGGGQLPYLWSISSGILPPGLSLDASTRAISGTSTATGTWDLAIQLSDSKSPVSVAIKAMSITVAAAGTYSLWPATAVPAIVDVGPDAAVELGLLFRSDVSGHIAGARFYKTASNTGAHVANLWTSTGTLLATATFIGETASGWQQVSFPTPVAIAANTVYVVSYHTNAGHYSLTSSYFTGQGVDNTPLHAPANGVTGGNGVYAYGSVSVFPTNSYQGSNYWVDVIFTQP